MHFCFFLGKFKQTLLLHVDMVIITLGQIPRQVKLIICITNLSKLDHDDHNH